MLESQGKDQKITCEIAYYKKMACRSNTQDLVEEEYGRP